MNISSMNPRDRRAVLLGAVILVPSLLYVFGVQPYLRALSSTRSHIADERELLVRERGVAAHLPSLPHEKAAASQRLSQEAARLFGADDQLVATGDLAEYIAKVAGHNGVSLEQTETRAPHPVITGLEALQVEVRAISDVDGMLQFLHELETGNKLIRIGRLSLEHARQMPGAGATQSGQASGTDMLELSASVYGYRLTGPVAGMSDSASAGASSPFARPEHDIPTMIAVADHNPFSPSRQRPVQTVAAVPSGPPPAPLRLVGTVMSTPERSFAICQRGEESPKVLHVGDQIAGFTLNALSRGRAVFATPDGDRLELQAPQPGMMQ
jgi:type II secretory pathway component PulM